jgi:hypothetical protein
MATYQRYNDTGLKKSIVDEIYTVQRYDTPILDTIAKDIKISDNIHYWTEVTYADVTANTTARYEGESLTASSAPTKTQYSNNVEENAVPYDVTTISATIAKNGGYAGVKDKIAEGRKNALETLKYNLEYSLLNGSLVNGNASDTPSKMRGLISTAETYGTALSFAGGIGTAGSEDAFASALTTARSKGGVRGKRTLIVNYVNKNLIGKNWKGIATAVQTQSDEATVYNDVRVYASQFGPISIVGHDLAPNNKLVEFDADMLNVGWLYNTMDIEMAIDGLKAANMAVANACTLQYNAPTTLLCWTIQP